MLQKNICNCSKLIFFTAFSVILFFTACQHDTSKNEAVYEKVLFTKYVNPFIGTDAHGHTFPGATTPFGMVQLSPDTHNQGWDWCSGYHYSDSSIMGFSHTHLSGTGRGDLLDILFMPTTGPIKWTAGTREQPDEGYRSRFSHDRESAAPGYYQVQLDDYNINVELTVSPRVGFHKYTFPASDEASIIIDLFHGLVTDSVLATGLEVVNDSLITGYRYSRGWGVRDEKYFNEQKIYFAAQLSKPMQSIALNVDGDIQTSGNKVAGRSTKAALQFKTGDQESILVKVGISAVDVEGALNNLQEEIPHWDFEKTKNQAEETWNRHLALIDISDPDETRKQVFYTAMYHAQIAPTLFSDADGRYLGSDKKIHTTKGFDNYTTFSLWDTFRASHPLFTIIQPKLVNDFIRSMLAQYTEYGLLPVWSLTSSETNCMIGYHAIPVIVDAYFKGIRDYDVELAYEAMKTSAMQDDFEIDHLKAYNYIPRDKAPVISVAMTLEYAFDDWCIAQMAKDLGKDEDYQYFSQRAKAFENLLDPETGFMRGRNSDGSWRKDFDPYNAANKSSDFIEGNSWQYSWFVPHDVSSLIQGMGGHESFADRLDSLFLASSDMGDDVPHDVTGLIGQYAHGNEPSHHVAYLFNYAGQTWKTQEKVHEIVNTLYDETPAGLCGNEDCGQMSAWYIFSALGFYPVNPAEGIYVIGKPFFEKAQINIPGSTSKVFEVVANNLLERNMYVQNVQLNGEPLERLWIRHEELMQGGTLTFEMGAQPNKQWGKDASSFPPSNQ
ncbi:MAG: GH92 family glycosyl hydrolase [Cyclobacteriaceae bacterium]